MLYGALSIESEWVNEPEFARVDKSWDRAMPRQCFRRLRNRRTMLYRALSIEREWVNELGVST